MAQASRGLSRHNGMPGPLLPTSQYEPVDTASGESLFGEEAERRCCCIDTHGRFFNTIVGIVICANAIFLAFEADLGLLGGGRPTWAGLNTDMELMTLNDPLQQQVKAEVQYGVEVDTKVKSQMQDQLKIQQNVTSVLALQSGSTHLKLAAYTSLEFLFIAFYIVELWLRFCDLGCRHYCNDPWFSLDFTCVVTGILDVIIPFLALGCSPALTALRVSRVLRIFRLFRVFDGLKVLAKPFVDAFSVVMRSALIVLIITFVCAVALTSLAGQQSYLWEDEDKAAEVNEWFGSIGRSMQTLFAVMTLSGWDHIVKVLAEVLPGPIVAPFFALYIMICTFAVVGLVSGAISDSFMAKARAEEKDLAKKMCKSRTDMLTRLTNVLSASCDADKNGYLTRDELSKAIESNPVVMEKLRKLDIDTTIEELLHLFDRLSQDALTADGSVKVGSMAEAIVSLAGQAQSSGIFDLKYLVLAQRREAVDRASEITTEFATRFQQTSVGMQNTAQEVAACAKKVGQLQQEVASVRQDVATVSVKLDRIEKAQEHEKRERQDTMVAINKKLEALAAQLTAVGVAQSTKIDGVASQLVAQASAQASALAASSDKVDTLSSRLASQLSSQATAQEKAVEKLATQLAQVVTRFDAVETASTSSTHAPSAKNAEPECTPSELTSEITQPEAERPAEPNRLPGDAAARNDDPFAALATASASSVEPQEIKPEMEQHGKSASSEEGASAAEQRPAESADVNPLLRSDVSADDMFGQLLKETEQGSTPAPS